jgi:hypothetical protein
MIVRKRVVIPKRSPLISYTKGKRRLKIQKMNKGFVKVFFPNDLALIENPWRFWTIVINNCDKKMTEVSKATVVIFEVE